MGIADKVLGAGGERLCRRQDVEVQVGSERVKFVVRQPTVAERDRIIAEKTAGAQLVAAVIACTIDPETNGPAFKPEHRDVLLAQPAGSWLDELGKVAMKLIVPDADAGKDSAPTASSSSSAT